MSDNSFIVSCYLSFSATPMPGSLGNKTEEIGGAWDSQLGLWRFAHRLCRDFVSLRCSIFLSLSITPAAFFSSDQQQLPAPRHLGAGLAKNELS
jgi:hypothetical protein